MTLRNEFDSNGYKPPRTDVNIIFMDGGLGDHVGSLSATDYMIKQYPYVNYLIWVPDFLLQFAKNVLPAHAIVRNYTDMSTKYNRLRPTVTTKWDGIVSPMKIHTVDYAFLKLCDENPAIEHKNYPRVNMSKIDISSFSLPERYVVITTGYTAKVREFAPETVNAIAQHCLSKGHTPVFLGQRATATGAAHIITGTFSSEIDYTVGLDLVDKTTLLQAAKIMDGAAAMVGVDNGLMHVAGCTKVPIVGGYTTVSPRIRAPIRDGILGKDFYPIVPTETLSCRFCQERTNFLYGHDYKFCMYKDYKCVKDITADKFIKELDKLL